MNVITQVPPEFYTFPFHLWDTDVAVVNSITDSVREMLWHQHLIHIDQHSMKNIHLHVDGLPNLSTKSVPFGNTKLSFSITFSPENKLNEEKEFNSDTVK